MTIIDREEIKLFRSRLYWEGVAPLFKHGDKSLKPLPRFKRDEKKNFIVPADRIMSYFQDQVQALNFVSSEGYIQGLYELFDALTQGAAPFSFDCGVAVAESDILEADPATAVQYLTRNIIATYFSTLKTHQGDVDPSLLIPGLGKAIEKSKAGRDYGTLARRVQDETREFLSQNHPWRDYLSRINDTQLLCTLVGVPPEPVSTETAEQILEKARFEVEKYNRVLAKILNSREKLAREEKNERKYIKALKGLEQVTVTVLGKINAFFDDARSLTDLPGISPGSWITPETDQRLKFNCIRLFMRFKGRSREEIQALRLDQILSPASLRYRIHLLLQYPHLAGYCGEFRDHPDYGPLYLALFQFQFQNLVNLMETLDLETGETEIEHLSLWLEETKALVDKMGLSPDDLGDEKKEVITAYLALVGRVHHRHLALVVDCRDDVIALTQDRNMEVTTGMRRLLFDTCFRTLELYARKKLPLDECNVGIRRRLETYAVNYTPQRGFYQVLFVRFVGNEGGSRPGAFTELLASSPTFLEALLSILSEGRTMANRLRESQIEYARTLLKEHFGRQ
ncbi:MAG: hypothetical protein MI747_23720 [Desulfobacterales bacterium]|nr:hypothetical protein [Desulfobacterales bacterium]